MTERSTILREIGLTPIWIARPSASSVASIAPVAQVTQVAPITVNPRATPTTVSDADRETQIASMGWDELITSIASCTACNLCKTRTNTVPGVGDHAPSWMVIGEAPGETEDRRGEPFVGRAGQLLDAMLAAVDKKRTQGVFITNVVKCRPPGNRDPDVEEILACAPYLKRQIALAAPKLLLAAGKFAAQTLLNRDDSVASMRASGGQFAGIPVVVTYHPSYLLRSPLEKAKAWDDLLKARAMFA